MPDRRLTQLPVLAALSTDDIFYVVDDPAGAASSRQVAASVFDARYLQTANNLSDLTNVVVARASLGLGTLAVVNDAPADGTIYGRQNNAWAAASVLPVVDETAIVYETGVPANTLTFNVTPYTAPRIVTWPDAALTVAGLEVSNIFTATQFISNTLTTSVDSVSAFRVRDAATNNIFRVDTVAPQIVISAPMSISGTLSYNVDSTVALRVRTAGSVSVFTVDTITPQVSIASQMIATLSDAGTNNLAIVAAIGHNSSDTPVAGFGTSVRFRAKSSTTNDTLLGRLNYSWVVATHATRAARGIFTVYDTAEREAIRIEASGTAPMLGVLGAAAIARPAAYTLASTATRTMPTPEAAFTGQDNAQAGAVYAKSADLITLQTRLNNVEGVLRQVIIDLASTSGFGFLAAA